MSQYLYRYEVELKDETAPLQAESYQCAIGKVTANIKYPPENQITAITIKKAIVCRSNI